ncbi:hypothetical protein [Myxococcus xanthus]|nr:hypothetical protein [Myxococcus xanthus]
MNVAPALARPELAQALGLSLMRFEPWLRQRRVEAATHVAGA